MRGLDAVSGQRADKDMGMDEDVSEKGCGRQNFLFESTVTH
jgi:hypothetical protein